MRLGVSEPFCWALEIAGSLEVQLIGHQIDRETVEFGHRLVEPAFRMRHEDMQMTPPLWQKVKRN